MVGEGRDRMVGEDVDNGKTVLVTTVRKGKQGESGEPYGGGCGVGGHVARAAL